MVFVSSWLAGSSALRATICPLNVLDMAEFPLFEQMKQRGRLPIKAKEPHT